MIVDLQMFSGDPDPGQLTPRQLFIKHALVMDAVKRKSASDAQIMALACGVAFNGDKNKSFERWVKSMNGSIKFEKVKDQAAENQEHIDDISEEEKDKKLIELAMSSFDSIYSEMKK